MALLLFLLPVPVLLSGAVSLAHAQPVPPQHELTPDDRARELYLRGDRLYAEGSYEEAVRAFEQAYRLSSRPGLLYNIANAYERLGRYELALSYLNRYAPDAPEHRRHVVLKRIRALEVRAEEQRQKESAASGSPGSGIAPNQAPPEHAASGEPSSATPATAAGASASPATVPSATPATVAGAPAATPTTPTTPATPPTPADANPATPATDASAPPATSASAPPATLASATSAKPRAQHHSEPALDKALTRDRVEPSSTSTVGYIVGGAGLASIGAGVALGLSAASLRRDAESRCSDVGGRPICPAPVASMVDSHRRRAIAADIAWGVGAAALGAGIYLVLSDSTAAEPRQATLQAAATPQGGELNLVMAF